MAGTDALEQDLRAFLGRLNAGDKTDVSIGADLFHEPFLSLDPSSVTVVTREQLRSALPRRARLFSSIGARGTRLEDLQTHRIDEHHLLVQTTWEVQFTDETAQPLALRSSYLLRSNAADWTVLAYINHQDIGAVIAARRAQDRV